MKSRAHNDDSYVLFGTEVLQKRLQALTKEIDGVRQAEDIEYIHRMRVASRRLRAAFDLFSGCFPEKKMRAWKKQIRGVTRALGEARDLDVQIECVHKLLDSITDAHAEPGVRRVLLRLQQKRDGLQQKVIASLERLEQSGVLQDMEETLLSSLVQARLNETSDQSPFVFQEAYHITVLRLEEMLAYESYVPQEEAVAQLHSMRIAAKRLRYTLEVFEPLYDGDLKPALQAVRECQEYLGDIHDADVWGDMLPVFREEEATRTMDYCGFLGPFKRLAVGITYLENDRRAFRKKRYNEFREYWETLKAEDVWGKLREIMIAKAKKHAPSLVTSTLIEQSQPQNKPSLDEPALESFQDTA